MANIGTFSAEKKRLHRHAVRTLTINNKDENESAPDFRLQTAGHNIGAARKKTSEAGRPYVSATLDDPSFPATVYARLIEGEEGTHALPQAQGSVTTVAPRPLMRGAIPRWLKAGFPLRPSALLCCTSAHRQS